MTDMIAVGRRGLKRAVKRNCMRNQTCIWHYTDGGADRPSGLCLSQSGDWSGSKQEVGKVGWLHGEPHYFSRPG